MSVTIRISEPTRHALKQMAEQQGSTMAAVLEAAVKNYRESLRIQSLNEAYARLSPKERENFEDEVNFWERATLRDGLEPEDIEY